MESLGQSQGEYTEGVAALQAELKNFLENAHGKPDAEATDLGKFLKATAVYFSQDVGSLRLALEQTTAERDKLHSDLLDANNRAQILAQEIDDRHANLERESHNLIRGLEAKHAEQLRFLQEQLESERETAAARWQLGQDDFARQLNLAKEAEHQLKITVDGLQKDNDKLLKELATMNDLINNLELAKVELEKELEASVASLVVRDKMTRSDMADGRTSPSVLAYFREENRRLRDINDELQADLESNRARASRSNTSELSHSNHSVKRRGSSTDYDSDSEMRISGSRKMSRNDLRKAESCGDLQSGDDDDAFTKSDGQSIATQLLMAKRSNSFESISKFKGKLMKVLEKWRAQFVNEILDGSGASEALRGKHESLLLDLEEKLIEAATTESALVAQLDEMKQKYEQLQEIQQVFEAETVMSSKRTEEQYQCLESALNSATDRLKQKEAECISLVSEMEHNRSKLENLEASIDAAIQEEMLPFKRCLDDHRNLVEAKCAEITARVDEAANVVVGVLEAERSLSDVRREKAEVLVKISELENNLNVLLNSFTGEVSDALGANPKCLCGNSKCSEMKSELDCVKAEILKILDEKEQLSKEKDTLNERPDIERKIEERVNFETALLQKRIKDLNQTLVDTKDKHEKEVSELENGLELMRNEFDSLDDYWQQKLDEDRALFDKERDTMDGKFDELQEKIKELEELLSKSEEKLETSSLSTIDERGTFEKQVVDLEEENLELRRQLAFYHSESSRTQFEEILTTVELQEELESLKSETQYDRFNYETELESYRTQIRELLQRLETLESQKVARNQCEARIVELESELSALESKHRLEIKNVENKYKQKLEAQAKLSGNSFNSGHQRLPVEHNSDTNLCRRAASPLPVSFPSNRLSAIFHGPPPTLCNKLVKPMSDNRSACRIELSVLQTLNNRLRHQDERVKQLELALKFQQQATDKILEDSRQRHESEIVQLERILSASQELLNQQIARSQVQADRLITADTVIQQLFTENSMLTQALDSVRRSLSVSASM